METIEEIIARCEGNVGWVTVRNVEPRQARLAPMIGTTIYEELNTRFGDNDLVLSVDYGGSLLICLANKNIRSIKLENENKHVIQILVKNPDTFKLLYGL